MGTIAKRLTSGLGAVALALSALGLLLFPAVTGEAAARGLSICAKSILPSLFPFFVVTNLWISMGYADTLSRMAAPVMETVFHLPGEAASALILGCVGGYPVGAQVTVQLWEAHTIDRDTARHMLFFCNNAGPAFIFGVVGAGIFQSVSVGLALYCIHVLSALLLGFLFRPKERPKRSVRKEAQTKAPSFPAAFTAAARQAGSTAMQVCIFVLFFSILTGFLSHFTPEALHTSPWFSLLLGSLELAGGANLLASMTCSTVWKLCAAAFLLGWAGLCVHSQTLSILDGTGLPAGSYLLGKLLQGIVSAVLAFLIAPLLPLPVACIAVQGPVWQEPVLQMLLLSFFVLWVGYILKITTGKAIGNRV